MDIKWRNLDLCEKIAWMEAAEHCLYDEVIVQDYGSVCFYN
jgi:hypothetical protein